MTLLEATDSFIEYTKRKPACDKQSSIMHALELLKKYFLVVGVTSLNDLTPARLRDFMARWWVEESSATQLSGFRPSRESLTGATDPKMALGALADFIEWLGEQKGADSMIESLSMIDELRQSLPRALEIKDALSNHIAARGGPFGFPEFLTSFEEGGHSQYDMGAGGEAGALEGYFRVTRVEGALIEAEDLISEERIWPIIFPKEAARLIALDYILNLEIVRAREGWQVAGSGFVYPPGTAIL